MIQQIQLKELLKWGLGFPKRAYTVMEVRTGFATGFPVLSSGLFAAWRTGTLHWLPLLLLFICGFSLNIAANTANEIRAYLKNEENEETFTAHLGSEGLVRGDATLLDAVLVLLGILGLTGLSGLVLVWVTGNFWLLGLGIACTLGAVCYSLGPKPYILYPVGELISGLLVGLVSSLVSSYLQLGRIDAIAFSYGWICMIMTIFLMSTNNTGDYQKDWGVRKTLPHVIGFRNSILLIIPEFITLFAAWLYLAATVLPLWLFLIGCWIFFYYGYWKWYRSYLQIQEVYPEMGREFGPRPLLVINHFHLVMSGIFVFLLWK